MKKAILISALTIVSLGGLLILYMGICSLVGVKPFTAEIIREELILKEDDGVKYYYSIDDNEYHLEKAIKTVIPRGDIRDVVDNKGELRVDRRGDSWTVDVVYNYYTEFNDKYTSRHEFVCYGNTFTAESLQEVYIGDSYIWDYRLITEHFATAEELRELIANGERIGEELCHRGS